MPHIDFARVVIIWCPGGSLIWLYSGGQYDGRANNPLYLELSRPQVAQGNTKFLARGTATPASHHDFRQVRVNRVF